MVLLSVERRGADNCDVGSSNETHGEIRDFAAKSRFCTPKNYAISLIVFQMEGDMNKSVKVGLALGSGSARGFSHIGIIRVLEAEGIPIDCIAGTSIGAIVGSVYAAGSLQNGEELLDLGEQKPVSGNQLDFVLFLFERPDRLLNRFFRIPFPVLYSEGVYDTLCIWIIDYRHFQTHSPHKRVFVREWWRNVSFVAATIPLSL